MSDTTREALAYERVETEHKRGVRAAVLIIAGLCGLCVLASLSGCLTATKIHRWESALLTWHRQGDAVCKEAVKPASSYIKSANDRLNNPENRAEDIESDGQATKLMTEAAVKCGEVVP